jgi:hypothetical protein
MIDLDNEHTGTPAAVRALRRAVTGNSDGAWTFHLPITKAETVRADGRDYEVEPGDVIRFEPTRTIIIPKQAQPEWSMDVVKAEGPEQRYTLGAWYIPDTVDAHGEWTDPATLQKAAWNYVRRGDRTVYLQHDRTVPAGELVEIMTMPQEWRVTKQDGTATTYPQGTVFAGVVWEPWAWQMVKAGDLRGLSIGGSAVRVRAG